MQGQGSKKPEFVDNESLIGVKASNRQSLGIEGSEGLKESNPKLAKSSGQVSPAYNRPHPTIRSRIGDVATSNRAGENHPFSILEGHLSITRLKSRRVVPDLVTERY